MNYKNMIINTPTVDVVRNISIGILRLFPKIMSNSIF